jgi:hypothetical protein
MCAYIYIYIYICVCVCVCVCILLESNKQDRINVYILTLLQVYFKHTLNNPASFKCVTNRIRILYKTSFMTHSRSSSSPYLADLPSLHISIFSRIFDQCKTSDVLCQNPHWWSTIICLTHEVNLYRRFILFKPTHTLF